MTIDHPAVFSAPIVKWLAELIDNEAETIDRPITVLDPFAGEGTIHRLPFRTPDRVHTIGVEIEPEWAIPGGCIVGDATRLPFGPGTFDVVATSPTYGNRFADVYLGQNDTCTTCGGDGRDADDVECSKCTGTGRRPSKRYGYAISLGRRPSPRSSGAMHWGRNYRRLHFDAWAEAHRVLRPAGLILVNVSDIIRAKKVEPVTDWHAQTLADVGFRDGGEAVAIKTRRMRHGQNHAARVENEWILRGRKPTP